MYQHFSRFIFKQDERIISLLRTVLDARFFIYFALVLLWRLEKCCVRPCCAFETFPCVFFPLRYLQSLFRAVFLFGGIFPFTRALSHCLPAKKKKSLGFKVLHACVICYSYHSLYIKSCSLELCVITFLRSNINLLVD